MTEKELRNVTQCIGEELCMLQVKVCFLSGFLSLKQHDTRC